jgi:hypothetical protein
MAKRVTRKFEAYAMHAHQDTPAVYADLFRRLSEVPRQRRQVKIADLVIGFPIVEADGPRYFIQSVEGGDSSALVYNVDTGRTRENILGASELLSEASHMVVAPTKRRAVIEYVRRGPKAALISVAIEGILRGAYPELGNLNFEMTPVIAKNFVSEINSFDRIRLARIRVAKPNAGWTDHYTGLSDLMEESGGDKGEIGVRAIDGRSLNRNAGVVKAIKDVVADAQPYLDDASVTGTREGETAETTIRAKKHIVHTKASVEADDAGVASAEDIRTRLTRFLNGL